MFLPCVQPLKAKPPNVICRRYSSLETKENWLVHSNGLDVKLQYRPTCMIFALKHCQSKGKYELALEK